nr:MAG TPA: hypothetical protein [Caudoviricetes sp.]
MIKTGDTLRFVPSAWSEAGKGLGIPRPAWMQAADVAGEIVYINAAHGFYRVRYTVRAPFGRVWIGHECFKMPPTREPDEPSEGEPSRGKYKGFRVKKEPGGSKKCVLSQSVT